MSNGIYVGGANPESVKVLSSTVLEVLNAPHADEKTKQLALKVLSKGVEAPSHLNISGCQITNDDSITKYEAGSIVNTPETVNERTESTEKDS